MAVDLDKDVFAREGDMYPPELTALLGTIARSRAMLDLPSDWDDEGAERIVEATWERATAFLWDNALALWRGRNILIEMPVISPASDGSVDLHWKNRRRQLLINVPVGQEQAPRFFGDDRGHTEVKGALDATASPLWLFEWLTK